MSHRIRAAFVAIGLVASITVPVWAQGKSVPIEIKPMAATYKIPTSLKTTVVMHVEGTRPKDKKPISGTMQIETMVNTQKKQSSLIMNGSLFGLFSDQASNTTGRTSGNYVIDGASYLLLDGPKPRCMKSPVPTSGGFTGGLTDTISLDAQLRNAFVVKGESKKASGILLGEDKIGGVPVQHFKLDDVSIEAMLDAITTTAKPDYSRVELWLAKQGNYIVQAVTEERTDNLGGVLNKLTGTTVLTVTLTEINTGAEVKLPTVCETAMTLPGVSTPTTKAVGTTAPEATAKSSSSDAAASGTTGVSITGNASSFEGIGDKIIRLPEHGPSILRISGNAAKRYFGITSSDDKGDVIDVLVSATDAYDGVRPLDLGDGQKTIRLQVKASGPWKIELLPLDKARAAKLPTTIEGKGDDVVLISGISGAASAQISGNKTKRYFGVQTANKDGVLDYLVNETDAYEGEVLVKAGARMIIVRATGPWTIAIKPE